MDGSLSSPDAFAPPVSVPIDAVSAKLRGGVWEHSAVARRGYAAVLSFGRWLSRLGVTPNALTYVALALAVASGAAAALGHLFTSAVLLASSGVLDLLDGVVARAAQLTSRFGALLDSTVDRLADALPLLGLVIAFGADRLASAVLMLAIVTGFAVSYVRARAEGLGVNLPPLFMRRAERLVMVLLALVVGSSQIPGFPSYVAMLSIICVMALLSCVAAVWALRAAYVSLEGPSVPELKFTTAKVEATRPTRVH